MRTQNILRLAVGIGLTVSMAPDSAVAQQPSSTSAFSFTSTTGRPMLDLVRELRENNDGFLISYEDPLYDTTHVTPSGSSGAFIPVAPAMVFQVPAAQISALTPTSYSERFAIVQALAAQHTAQSGPNDPIFAAELDGGRIAIKPTTRLTPGQFAVPNPYKSPLDTPVTLGPAASYPGGIGAAVQDVISQAATGSGVSMAVGDVPINIFFNNKMIFDPPKGALTAAQALSFIFSQINADEIGLAIPRNQLTWDLVNDAGTKAFYFNVTGARNSAPVRSVAVPAVSSTPSNSSTGFISGGKK